jgi:preprotein translocase subunit SecG
MMIIFWLLLVAFVLVCIALCFFVLIQSDKGGGISGAIGGGLGGAQSLLGTQDTANFLTRATVGLGIAFLVLCVGMSVIMSNQTYKADKSILQKRAEKQSSFSPSSVLNTGGGLPIKSSGQGAAATAGLPVVEQNAPVQPEAKPGAPAAVESKSLPVGAIPIAPPAGEKKK